MSPPRAASRLPLLLPWLVLVIALGVTGLVWDHERQVTRKELRSQFDFALRETVSRVEQRVATYELMLRGVQGLLSTTGLNNRNAVRRYVETLQLDANFSGIKVIGLIENVAPEQKSAHESAMRKLGFADYTIHPQDESGLFTPVIQHEPFMGKHRVPLGLNVWADPVRRLAMEKARDSGMAAISGKVALSVDQPTNMAPPAFIMYLPVFAHGQARESVDQRRSALVGWVFAAFHMHDFMASLYGKQPPGIDLAIYDDVNLAAPALMYHSGNSPSSDVSRAKESFSAHEYMVVAGQNWTLALSTQDDFFKRNGFDAASVIAFTGIGLSLTLTMLGWFLVTARHRALRLADKMTEQLRHMAQHDPLTGLPNRALFSDRLNQALAHAKRHQGQFAVIFLDLDNFKPVNDNHGHAVGDAVLSQVSQRLQDSIRASDTVARLGGDEFVVLMPSLANSKTALDLAEKIRQAVREPCTMEGLQLHITCSIGIAVYPDDGTDEFSLTRSADEAMYLAKGSGRDSVLPRSSRL